MVLPIGCYLGIDPGKYGGIALISHDRIAQAWPMPLTLDSKGKEIVDEAAVGRLFRKRLVPAGILKCILERVHSMPGQGVASTFKFGRNAGLLVGMLTALEIPFEEMGPETWQRSLNIKPRARIPRKRGLMFGNFPPEETKHGYKKRLMAQAKKVFPGMEITLETADALLIAETSWRIGTGLRGVPL